MDKEKALKRFARSRQHLRGALQGLREETITLQPVEGYWTAKDLLAHLSAWEEALLVPLRLLAGGGHFEAEVIPDHDAWNGQKYAGWKGLTLSQIDENSARVREEILALVDSLPEGVWEQKYRAPWGDTNTLAEMIAGLAWHEEEHTKSILKTLAPGGGAGGHHE